MKKVLILFLFISVTIFAQNLNQYKYALVPSKFTFLKETNMYNLNFLTKLYMEKYGFEAYLDNETFSDGFANENCNKIFIDVENNSNMFTTKLSVVVKDCKNTVLFKSEEGKSNDKEFKVAYNIALREAFDNFSILKGHKYQPSQKGIEANGETSKIVVVDDIILNSKSEGTKYTTLTSNVVFGQYYAQPIVNGFQIINSESKMIYKIYNTSTKNFFIATKGTTNGVFFLRNNYWYFEFYELEKLISEKVDVKF